MDKKLSEPGIGRVYKITSPSGRIYIGSTTLLLKIRFRSYKSLKCKGQIKLYNSLIKYGWDNHISEQLWEGDIILMYQKEYEYGLLYNVLDYKKGLNLLLPNPNSKSVIVNKESSERRSIAQKNRKSFTEEHRKNISKSKLGKVSSIKKKPIKSIDKNNNELEFDSAKEAAKYFKIGRSSIVQCYLGMRNNCFGITFKYINHEDKT